MSASIDSAYYFAQVQKSFSGAVNLAGRAAYQVGLTTMEIATVIGNELYQAGKLSTALGQQVIQSIAAQIQEERNRIEQEQKAFEAYKTKIKQDQTLSQDYQKKLSETLASQVQFFDKTYITNLQKNNPSLETLEQITAIEHLAERYQSLYLRLMEVSEFFEEKELEPFYQFYAQFKSTLLKENINEIELQLTQQISILSNWLTTQKSILKEKLKNRKFNEIFYELEHSSTNGITLVFQDAVTEWLKSDKDAAELNYQEQLITYAQEINDLFLSTVSQPYFDEIQKPVLELMKSVDELKNTRGKFSLEDRVAMLNTRKKDLQRMIASLSSEQVKNLELKEMFDEQLAAYLFYKKRLEITDADSLKITFNPQEAEAQIQLLNQTNELLAEKVKNIENKEKAFNLLKATLTDYQYEFIGSETNRYQGATLIKGYFTDATGNVLMTTVGSDNISMDIVGVKEQGKDKDSVGIYTSEQTLCDVYPSIVKTLSDQGLTLQETMKIPPSLEGTKEIVLPSTIAVNHQMKKKRSKGRSKPLSKSK